MSTDPIIDTTDFTQGEDTVSTQDERTGSTQNGDTASTQDEKAAPAPHNKPAAAMLLDYNIISFEPLPELTAQSKTRRDMVK